MAEFQKVNLVSLSVADRIDWELITSNIQAGILDLDGVRPWQRDPDKYSSGLSEAVYVLMVRQFAPAEERLRSVIKRENEAPTWFSRARANLKNPPKIYTEIALEQIPGIISFFETDVPSAFSSVKDSKLLSDFKASNDLVISELKKYEVFLRNQLLPKSKGDFRIGGDTFSKKLKYEEMVEMPLDKLLEMGCANLRENQNALKEVAKKIDPKKTFAEVLADQEKDHPRPEELLNSVRSVVGGLKQFIIDKKIVTIPSPVEPIIQETPPFQRATTFASMDTPGPFETLASEAYYNVTLVEPGASEKQIEEHMAAFTFGTIISTSIHEAYPGHYTQFLWVPKAHSRARKMLGANTNVEGWAHYTEQMMLDEGYGEGNLKLRFGQLMDALLRNSRYIVGIQMHRGKMSFEEGIDFFVNEGFTTRANAEMETKRGTSDPTYLYYTLGKLQLLKLREDYKKLKGDQFSLLEFHDSVLKEGFPPVKLLRRALLGEDRF